MVRLSTITTKTGDSGTTALGDGSRVSKSHPRIEALGAVDETNAALGVARTFSSGAMDADLAAIQNDLFDVGADLCIPSADAKTLRISETQVLRLEQTQSALNAELKPLDSFVLPGGSALAAQLHVARTLARRAERRVVALAAGEAVNPALLRYLNRLSDFLFVLARCANAQGHGDVLWVPGQNR